MARPFKQKIVSNEPDVTYFKPRGVPLRQLKEVELTVDELETLRLANIEKLSQAKAAKMMKVHQSTFQRTLARACEKVSDALVNGKAIKIHGGKYKMVRGFGLRQGRGRGFGPGRGQGRILSGGRGRMGGPLAAGPGGICVCEKCGYEQEHIIGQPCNKIKCPECNAIMQRR